MNVSSMNNVVAAGYEVFEESAVVTTADSSGTSGRQEAGSVTQENIKVSLSGWTQNKVAAEKNDDDSKQESPIIKALKDQIKALQDQLQTQMQQLQKLQARASKDPNAMSSVASLQAGMTQTSVQLQQAVAKLAEVIAVTSGAYTKNLVDTTA
ncbi:hypothetical protein [Cupriavidus sp. 2SB]|uniref:hypothetical protein n=1 Tax=Cupriavidus sp. 2SB TaxID=2502199 RepID=UPI0010F48C84|nr:hypothetical protein [Cupriavidus sp. 2SB]